MSMPSRGSTRLAVIARNFRSLLVSVGILCGLVSAAAGESPADDPPIQSQVPSQVPPRAQPGRTTPPLASIRHDTKYKGVPGSKLQVRAVEYDGATNGKLKVQVRNTGTAAQKFSATGLYFVPEGDPDSAPQRLGAVGPMQLAGNARAVSELVIKPGQTVDVALDVFCIDSHRSSPSPSNVFNVGATRLPKQLATKIEQRADAAVKAAIDAGDDRPAATDDIQREVWNTRDAYWHELDGEGRQEAGKKK